MSGGLTVEQCFKMFPAMTGEHMERLVGKKDYDKNTEISAGMVVAYKGKFSKELSIFYMKNDTEEFAPLLSNKKQKRLAKTAGIDLSNVESLNKQDQSNNAKIDKDVSIFDIAREQKEKENKTEYA